MPTLTGPLESLRRHRPPRRLISRWDAASLRAANGGGYQVPFDQRKALGQGWRGRKVEARESHPRASVSMTLSLILDIPLIRGALPPGCAGWFCCLANSSTLQRDVSQLKLKSTLLRLRGHGHAPICLRIDHLCLAVPNADP